MTNICGYFLALESLELTVHSDNAKRHNAAKCNQESGTQDAKCALSNNIKILRKYIKEDLTTVLEKNLNALQLENVNLEHATDDISVFVIYLEHVLLEISANVNFASDAKEDLISSKHINLCIQALQELSTFALEQNLHPTFYKDHCFQKFPYAQDNFVILYASIVFFHKMLQIQQFHISNSMQAVIRAYMAGIFSIRLTKESAVCDEKDFLRKLDSIWNISKMEYFRNLMLFRGLRHLHKGLLKQLTQELMIKLMSPDGFTTLVATLHRAQQSSANDNTNSAQTSQIIANIVAHPDHSRYFQTFIIEEIFKFINLCLRNEAMLETMAAGLLALRRLYDLNEANRTLIVELIDRDLKKLSHPTDVLSGLILMEHQEFSLLISKLYQLFYTSIVECLPSNILEKYLPLLLEVFYNIPEGFSEKQQLAGLVARCLNNVRTNELKIIVEKLYKQSYDSDIWFRLHNRVVIFPNAGQTQLQVKIVSADYKPEVSISLSMPELLMSTHYHPLTYNVFMILLELMSDELLFDSTEARGDSIDLLQTENELVSYLNAKYPLKVEILLSLNTLVAYKHLKSQIIEHSKEFLQFLRKLLERRLENVNSKSNESTDNTLLILLTLTQEFIEDTKIPESYDYFIPILQRLQKITPNELIQRRVICLIGLLSGNVKIKSGTDSSAFSQARLLMESSESHLQVYGMQMLLELIKRRDDVTISNGHAIIAMALNTLKDKESYTFLNCVRLFVGLVNIMEPEVFEVLSDEYLNENAEMDFRLVVGEAILKISQELGSLCYKYKSVLLNCFMHGARSSMDEFRMSSFANLAQICRTLCYQVQKFFQELLLLIDCELTTGKYIPAKRSAVMVLSELLAGMDNLIEFEEMLLPIYRILKNIDADEYCDEKMRIHAANGLKVLAEKCKKLLFPNDKLQKEIKIFGIKDQPKEKMKKHILEIN